jgi:hypothetical protein
MVHLKMMKKTALKKLMEAYSARQSLQMGQIRFYCMSHGCGKTKDQKNWHWKTATSLMR